MLEGDTGIDYEQFARESYRILKPNSHAYFSPALTATRITTSA